MANPTRIRDHGLIPEKRHDAFLLALLLALALNVAFFAVQALLPKVASLLSLLAPEPSMARQEQEPYPFVLVDPSLLDEDIDPDIPPDAESDRSREARDTEAHPDLPEEKPYQEEGVEEILSLPTGNPGPAEASSAEAPGDPAPDIGSPGDPAAQEALHPEPMEDGPEERDEAEDDGPPEEPVAATHPLEAVPELPEPPPAIEAPPPDIPAIPEEPPSPERVEAPEPELPQVPIPDLPPVEIPPVPDTPPVAILPEPDTASQPVEEMPELAFLPVSPDGFFAPPADRLQEMMPRPSPPPLPPPERREGPQPFVPLPQPQPEAPLQQQEVNPRRPQSSRRGQSGVPVREIGRTEGGAVAGGAPPQRNRGNTVNLLDSDPNMRILAHRYGEYMRKVARQLQESLIRVIMMNPSYYSRGQGRIHFSIAADGRLAFLETQYPNDGSDEVLRIISETTVREAAPFDPPTRQMLEDPLFRRMSLTVHLY